MTFEKCHGTGIVLQEFTQDECRIGDLSSINELLESRLVGRPQVGEQVWPKRHRPTLLAW